MALIINSIKTPGMKILGVFLCLIFPQVTWAECGQGAGPIVQVSSVVDGDTLRLSDGHSVRVIGINAPEIRRGAKAGQSLGGDARAAAQAFINASGGKVTLGYESEREDHYGRQLAHVYDHQGRSLGVELLNKGLVFAVAVPPNVKQADCLYAKQDAAYRKHLGVWGNRSWNPQPSAGLDLGDTGFRRVKGKVEKVAINSSVWIELEGNLVLQVARYDWQYFPQKPRDWRDLVGKTLETEGWIIARKRDNKGFKPLMMKVRSPRALRFVSP